MGTQRTKILTGETKKKDKYAAKAKKTAATSLTLPPAEPSAPTPLTASKAPSRIKSPRGRRYAALVKDLDLKKTYPPEEALLILKSHSFTKFDPTVEAHFRLGIPTGKTEAPLRLNLILPHGTGKKVKVLVFSKDKTAGADLAGDETILAKIEEGELKAGKDFQAVVATPEMMPKIARLGKILGPKGLMPNPKSGTVSSEPEKVIARLKAGQIEVKSEPTAPLLHFPFGKLSFAEKQLLENLTAAVTAVKSARPAKTKGEYLQSLTLSSTMGPGVKVDLNYLKP